MTTKILARNSRLSQNELFIVHDFRIAWQVIEKTADIEMKKFALDADFAWK